MSEAEPNVENESESGVLLPEKPIKPLDSECCGTGCTPCVFDIHNKALLKWEKECQNIINGIPPSSTNSDVPEDSILSPTKYKEFKIIAILSERSSSSKIFRISCFPEPCDISDPLKRRGGRIPVEIGQHIVVTINKIARKYTILRIENEFSHAQSQSTYFDVLVRIYPTGQLTQLLDKLHEGDILAIRGPFSNVDSFTFTYRPNQLKQVVMLAAGSGIAPMYRVIETILQNEEDETRITLFYANKTLQSIMLGNELKEWSSFWNFQVHHYISNPEKPELVPYGLKVHFQRITLDVARDNFAAFVESDTLFLICGTNSFEKDMINYLQKIGITNKCVHVF